MKYINKKTRAVIETACVLKGGDWVEVNDKQPKKDTEESAKKTTRKKRGEQNE